METKVRQPCKSEAAAPLVAKFSHLLAARRSWRSKTFKAKTFPESSRASELRKTILLPFTDGKVFN